ncbi:hypothetical protein AM501_16735 [Aneurinibacillus migulanus]|uniref:Superoxide dismutase, Cu-Zn family n=1 Tax=Aneurinibacillus migulanus TaxID=47500 RepID=A0A0D1Y684_ANEMI|nr:superoxide dismutase family protein [Aneurinibacillus migulanus]KIV57430.1 hypothetical protein TS65_09290 [Aneurinibacillus migulanus]KIV59958.1 hypothetical protein TS64_00425 [Aneurinibacillus migulanus]KON94959.1 hypothetical protein AF333_05135 [Aneurinibacillus migulanus]KPD07157.1 hypothetical protein AM501_16735 [Aneurinibacillus migulanus]MCP1354839.1 superoxide dismutase family protein [Aneurinibacillus migulanus]
MKKFMAGVVAGVVLSSGMAYAASITVNIAPFTLFADGEEKTFGKDEVLVHNGRAYVPVRAYAETFQHKVYWDGTNASISINKPYIHMVNAQGEEIGHAILTEESGGVKVAIEVHDLKPGKHGFHVHEKMFVKNDFKSAGGHFNPDGKKHGMENPEGHHVGDMQNLEVKEDGTAKAEFMLERASLKQGDVHSLLGKSIIIHEGEDDLKSDPAGNSGDRVAGGNIPQ